VTGPEIALVIAAGFVAGGINTVVGSGTLITFPVLLGIGYPPVVANVSNSLGLVPGSVTGAIGYRRELRGQRGRLVRFGAVTALGAITGALLLLRLPAEAFRAIVPVLLAISLVLVVVQPRMQAAVAAHRERHGTAAGRGHDLLAMGGTYLAGVYGGYFGAAQGVLLIGLLGSLLPESLQRVNAVKNLLSLVVNGVAAIVFVAVAFGRIDWRVVGLVAVGSLCGGFLGARFGRRLPPAVLRGVIVVVGVVAIGRVVTG
jgi:uncharacterized membrane protein YfcA